MESTKFYALCKECEALLRARAPYKTGNLRIDAIKVSFPDAHTCVIYVDESIAPYMKYTNEPWEQRLITMGNFRKGERVTRMRTWDNPHEGWFDKAAQEIAELIAARLHGVLS